VCLELLVSGNQDNTTEWDVIGRYTDCWSDTCCVHTRHACDTREACDPEQTRHPM
jgi:hypothetical protein